MAPKPLCALLSANITGAGAGAARGANMVKIVKALLGKGFNTEGTWRPTGAGGWRHLSPTPRKPLQAPLSAPRLVPPLVPHILGHIYAVDIIKRTLGSLVFLCAAVGFIRDGIN